MTGAPTTAEALADFRRVELNINEFAEQHRLKVRRDPDDVTDIIPGKFGHLYEYSDTEIALCFIPAGEPRARLWGNISRSCLAAEMTLRQNGDAEGCISFDPTNPEQAKLAIRAVRARTKKQLSAEQLARLSAIGFKAKSRTVEGLLAA